MDRISQNGQVTIRAPSGTGTTPLQLGQIKPWEAVLVVIEMLEES
jgi:hypothetical protein